MRLWYGILGLLVLGICIAGCTQPLENVTGNETLPGLLPGNETTTETPMETPAENMTGNETPAMNETPPGVPPAEPPATLNESAYSVSIQDSGFNPASLEVPTGSMVVWTNEGSENQTVTGIGLGNAFDSGLIAPGENFTWGFMTPGIYNYTSQTTGASGNVVVGTMGETNSTGQ
ncbi:hypothetical protein [Methanoculleus taiwanensis]|nr:hypothetical protein [Methanoculleus taiwanensis]